MGKINLRLKKHSYRGLVALLLIRQDFKCFYCNKLILLKADNSNYKATLDHKTPLIFGGEPFGENVAAACYLCNSRKGCLDADTFFSTRNDHSRRRQLLREAQTKISKLTKADREFIRRRIKESYKQSRLRLWVDLRIHLEIYKQTIRV